MAWNVPSAAITIMLPGLKKESKIKKSAVLTVLMESICSLINNTNIRSTISWIVECVRCLESKANDKELWHTSGVYRARQLAEGQFSGEESCYDNRPSRIGALHVALYLKTLSAANPSTFGFKSES